MTMGEPIGLTPLQAGMVFHALTSPGSGIDIEQIVFELAESLDVERFTASWNAVILRHDALASAFDLRAAPEPTQRADPQARLSPVVHDWSGLTPEAFAERFAAFRAADRRADFPLSQAPVMRLNLFRRGEADWTGLWSFHHAILDGRSFPLVLDEIFHLYDGGDPAALPQRRPFRDHVEAVRALDPSDSRGFWLDYLDGFDAGSPAMPHEPHGAGVHGFSVEERRLDRQASDALRAAADAAGVTVNTMIQAAWALLRCCERRRDDLVFAVTRAGRAGSVEGAADMIGLLINTVPLRVRLAADRSVSTWLSEVREAHNAVRDHEHTPLAEILRWSGVASADRMLDSLVVYDTQSLAQRMAQRAWATGRRRFDYEGQTNFGLALVAYGDPEILVRVEYDGARIAPEHARRLSDGLVETLARMPARLEDTVASLAEGLSGSMGSVQPGVPAHEDGAAHAFWARRIAELEPLLPPYAHAVAGAGDAPVEVARSIAVPDGLAEVARALGYAPRLAVAAAVLVYLARVGGQTVFDVDVTLDWVAVDAHGQAAPATVPLRVDLTGVATFVDVLAALDDELARVGPHAATAIRRRPLAAPGVPALPVVLAGAGAMPPPARGGGLVLAIDAEARAVGLAVRPGFIAADDLGRIARQIGACLSGVTDRPQLYIRDVPTMPDAERAVLLGQWNDPARAFEIAPSLAAGFERAARRHAARTALSFEGGTMTYGELSRRSSVVAAGLRARGAKAGVLVGLAMERSPELIIGLLGILKSGAAYLPLDPTYPRERLHYMVEHAGAPLVLAQAGAGDHLPADAAEILDIAALESESPGGDPPVDSCTADDLAYVMYTSGSTGRPKGVQITHRNVLRLLAGTDDWFGFDENDVWTLFHSYAFDFTVWEIWGALLYGGRLVIPSHRTTRSPADFLRLLERERVTVLNQTPSAFRQLIEADAHATPTAELSLRYVIFGGEALNLAHLAPWVDRRGDARPRLVNMFGITETTVHVTYRPITREDIESGSGSVIGRPIPDLQLYVLDRWMQPMPTGVVGEIYVGGAGLARGYLKRPELTAERFVPDPFSGHEGARLYKTGDLARYLPNGDLEYLGRADFQIQLRGFRVELGEIEAVLLRHPRVRKVVVDVRTLDSGDQQLVAWVVSDGPEVPAGELRELAAGSLAEYMVPQHYVAVDEFPLTVNGKLDKAALPMPRRSVSTELVAPVSETESRIAAIWRELLDLDEVGTRDTFFDLGGHSLLVMHLAGRLSEAFGREVAVPDMFRYPTIAAQAKLLATAPAGDGEAADDAVAAARAAADARRNARSRVRRRPAQRPGGRA